MKKGKQFHIFIEENNKIIKDNKINDEENNITDKKEKQNPAIEKKDETIPLFKKKKNRQKSRNKTNDVDGRDKTHSSKKNNKNKSKINQKNSSQTKTKDSATLNSASTLKETQMTNEDKNIFDFQQSIWNIIFLKKIKNERGEIVEIYEGDIYKKNLRRNIINNKIKMLYNLLIVHMKYLKEKVLLQKGKLYFFETIEFYLKKFKEIERYLINCILLIKFFLILGDPESLIKANQTLNYLAKELLDYNPNGGILVYSINTIMKKCINLLKIRKYYRSIHVPYEIIKSYLLILSALIKISRILCTPRLYNKFLNHYAKIFEIALFLISPQHIPEKIILKTNLLFNCGSLMVKSFLLKSGMKIFEEVINIQEKLEHKSFIFYASYYNCSTLYFVMGDLKNTDLFLTNITNITEKVIFNLQNTLVGSKKELHDFRIFECILLIFSAEYYMEKENYLKALENLNHVIKLLEKIYKKRRFNITRKFESKSSTKTIHSRNRMREEKKSMTIRKKVEKLPYEFLYENEFYENPLEKMSFSEKIKEIVSGLFDAILFLQREKEIKLKEKNISLNKDEFDEEFEIKRQYSDKNIFRKKGLKIQKRSKSFLKKYERLNTLNNNNISKIKENLQTKTDSEEKDNFEENNKKTFISEKNSNMILNYFKDEFAKKIKIINNEGDNNDFKYFVLLLSKLSLKQIEILNDTQNSDVPTESFYNLPIFFGSQFKHSLNQAQKNIFDKLNFLSLIRCKVLADPSKKIGVSNINFKKFQSIRINIKLKNYDDITNKLKKILNERSNKNYLSNGQKKFGQTNNKEKYNNEEDISSEDNKEKVEFRYKKAINLKKFKKDIINEINLNYPLYSQDEINDMILIINSKIFIALMNRLDLKEIKDLEKDKSLLIEILNNEIKKSKEAQLKEEIYVE